MEIFIISFVIGLIIFEYGMYKSMFDDPEDPEGRKAGIIEKIITMVIANAFAFGLVTFMGYVVYSIIVD